MEGIEPCEFLPWDSEFFGCRIGRVVGHRLNLRLVEDVVGWSKAKAIQCLYFLADSNDAETVRLAGANGFDLVDVRVELTRQLKVPSVLIGGKWPETRVGVRHCQKVDIPTLQAIARSSHRHSRFYFDPHFPVSLCEALYERWIGNSCEGDADAVLVAEMDGQPVGYISCHLDGNRPHGRIGLAGVELRAQGAGVGQLLMQHCLQWFAERGAEEVGVATQARNIGAQRLYQRCGFLTRSVYLWYHKWLSAAAPADAS